MMTELCAFLKNYFLVDYLHPDERIHYGSFAIEDGQIEPLSFLKQGQYFRIVGSDLNDGVWQYGISNDLTDETFEGAVWAMSIPPDVIALADEILAWCDQNASAVNSPYQSESFAGYSYTLKSGSSSASGGSDSFGWQTQFAARLAPYRRLSVL